MRLIYALILLILIAVGLYFLLKKSSTTAKKTDMIDTWLAQIKLTLQEVMQQFAMTEAQVERELKYEGLSDMTKLYHPDKHPGHFYFQKNQFKMLYINADNLAIPLEFAALKTKLGEGNKLRSRAGKMPHFVYPEKGLAFSVKKDKVVFIEVFPNTTMEKYLAEIYVEPPVFRK